MDNKVTAKGYFEPKFEAVQQQFLSHFHQGKEKGAGLAIWHKGKLVVNLWAGQRDKALSIDWTEDTLANVFSTSKMISALCIQHAIDQGALDIARPVKTYWPAFNCDGKGDTPLAWFLNHRAGLPALKKPVPKEALFDWDYMCRRLAKETPWWQPGKFHGYHMITYGWLVGEAFRRLMGVTLGQYLAEQIANPMKLDLYLGGNDQRTNVADLFGAGTTPEAGRIHLFDKILGNPECMAAKALTNPTTLMTSSNKPEWRKMELPSANIHCSATGLATLLGQCVSSNNLLSDAALRRLMTEESCGKDPVLTTETRFGPGVMLQTPNHPEASFGQVDSAFGHPGSGGALAFADPVNQVGFAYVMNQMGPYLMVDPRPRALVDAFYCVLNQESH